MQFDDQINDLKAATEKIQQRDIALRACHSLIAKLRGRITELAHQQQRVTLASRNRPKEPGLQERKTKKSAAEHADPNEDEEAEVMHEEQEEEEPEDDATATAAAAAAAAAVARPTKAPCFR